MALFTRTPTSSSGAIPGLNNHELDSLNSGRPSLDVFPFPGLATYGTNFADVIVGAGFDDAIFGYGGDDLLDGLGGNDSIFGGDGNDTINGGHGNDSLYGGVGNDLLRGGTGSDRLRGGVGADELRGGDNADYLYIGDGLDYAYADAGNDFIFIADAGTLQDHLRGFASGGTGYDILYLPDNTNISSIQWEPDDGTGGGHHFGKLYWEDNQGNYSYLKLKEIEAIDVGGVSYSIQNF